MQSEILEQFNLEPENSNIETIGNGLINHTWKVSSHGKEYILQKVNTNVFTKPAYIADNISQISQFLSVHHPDYFFVSPVQTKEEQTFIEDKAGQHFRLFPFVNGSHTVNTVDNTRQACEAAKQFGKFTQVLSGFDATKLNTTLPDFHNLSLRFQQFETAVANAKREKLDQAADLINSIYQQRDIVNRYEAIVNEQQIPLRVCHHDTKISNVLFDDHDHGICVIDLDTVMPGYIISDVGDMLRTYLSPVSEEETDFRKITIRIDYFEAIIQGYTSEMDVLLTPTEKDLLIYSGKFMMYMQAIRFLADFLNGDVYYQISYPMQNFYRTQNQLTLLQRFTEKEPQLQSLL